MTQGAYGFSWIREGKLAGLAMPGTAGSLDDDIAWLRERGIRLLVSLTESPINPDLLARHDISALHLPVSDFTPPSIEQLHRLIAEIDMTIGEGKAAAIHCAAGRGRTGTALAAWLIAHGTAAEEAIREIRRLRPGSIETGEQESVLRRFEHSIRGLTGPDA